MGGGFDTIFLYHLGMKPFIPGNTCFCIKLVRELGRMTVFSEVSISTLVDFAGLEELFHVNSARTLYPYAFFYVFILESSWKESHGNLCFMHLLL